MMNKIINYVRTCLDYQRIRVYYYKSYNELFLILSNNVNLFYTIIMNFIINMLSARDSYINKIYDVILIIIDRLIKYVTYIVTIKNLKANKLINII